MSRCAYAHAKHAFHAPLVATGNDVCADAGERFIRIKQKDKRLRWEWEVYSGSPRHDVADIELRVTLVTSQIRRNINIADKREKIFGGYGPTFSRPTGKGLVINTESDARLPAFALRLRVFSLLLCCGGLLATTSTARSKHDHTQGSVLSLIFSDRIFAMSSNDQEKRLFLYRTLMVEIKERISYLDGAINKTYKLPELAAYELCHVQIRIICELIATACLLAHGDIPATYTKRLHSKYVPKVIFAELEKLHPDFYPRACCNEIKIGPPTEFSILEDGAFLPREKLITLHGLTGNVLHSRRVKDIGKPYDLDFRTIDEWKQKIVGQLRVHMISHLDRENFIVCLMQDPATGRPSTITGRREFASPRWKEDEDRRFAPKDRKKPGSHRPK